MHSDKEEISEKKLISLEEIQDAIECIICLDIPKADPVFQCTNGHILCGNCHKRVIDCPICKTELGTIRALAIEKVLSKYPRNCRYGEFGCNVKLIKDELQTHERFCEYRSAGCPLLMCKKLIPQKKLLQHINEDHTNCHIKVDKPSWNGDFSRIHEAVASTSGYSWYPTLVEFDGNFFFQECWKNEFGNWHVWVYMVGNCNESRKYVYSVKIIHPDNIEELSYTGHCVSLHVEKEEISKLGSCLVFDDIIANRFCNGNYTIAYSTEIRQNTPDKESMKTIQTSLDGENLSTSSLELFQEVNELSDKLQTTELKTSSGRERRRVNSLIREKRKRLEQILISQGIQSLKDATKLPYLNPKNDI